MITIGELQKIVEKRYKKSKKLMKEYDNTGTQIKYLAYKTKAETYKEMLDLIKHGE